MAVILTDRAEYSIRATDGLRVSSDVAETVTGRTLKPEGMCRDELCVPLDAEIRRGGDVDLAAFWRLLGNPVLSDPSGEVWMLGTSAESRASALADLEAPDFTLPDLAGMNHSLSAHCGKKIFLTTWASWRGCRNDLSVWQDLYNNLIAEPFIVIAVAEDSGGADTARPWIEKANLTYPCMIDVDHRVAALYGMVNVP